MILSFFEKIKNFVKKIYDFIFPKKCICCKMEGFNLCKKCLKKIPSCEKMKEDWIISIWSYKDGIIKKAIWLIKFKSRYSILEDLEDEISDAITSEVYDRQISDNFTNPVLIPIPMFHKKLKKRGYNQSELIADLIYKKHKDIFSKDFNSLRKIKNTGEQNKITQRRRRFENIRGCFQVINKEKIKNKNIILIDDITTTHATLLEAKRVLEKSGARKVLAFTIAH